METALSVFVGIIVIAIGLAIGIILFLLLLYLGSVFIKKLTNQTSKPDNGKTRNIS